MHTTSEIHAGSKTTKVLGRPKKSRHIPSERKTALAVAAGGRCEFRGCSKYLFEHPISLSDVNLSKHAHIYAFSEDGPRGDDPSRPADIHGIDNLMLMCGDCHDEIDKNKALYPAPRLIEMKREHEERIRYLTGLGPESRTSLLILRGQIADRPVDISFDEMRDAVAPMYPIDRKGRVIDVSNLGDDRAPGYFENAARVIRLGMKDFYARQVDGTAPRHVSVFALASIPLLVLFGRNVSDKIQVQFYQRHRGQPQPWKWQDDADGNLNFDTELLKDGADRSRIGLILSISGKMARDTLPRDIHDNCPLFEISVADELPDVRVLRRHQDLDEFRRVYGRLLSRITAEYPECRELHLFPAVPAPVAVMCGHERLPKVQPTLCVYDNTAQPDGKKQFVLRLKIDDYEQQ